MLPKLTFSYLFVFVVIDYLFFSSKDIYNNNTNDKKVEIFSYYKSITYEKSFKKQQKMPRFFGAFFIFLQI